MRIHITQTTKSFLQNIKYETEERGQLELSESGVRLKTFNVVGKYNKLGNLIMFPYEEEKEKIAHKKHNPKWEGFKLVKQMS